jgi:hypothetical protein
MDKWSTPVFNGQYSSPQADISYIDPKEHPDQVPRVAPAILTQFYSLNPASTACPTHSGFNEYRSVKITGGSACGLKPGPKTANVIFRVPNLSISWSVCVIVGRAVFLVR